MFGVRRFIAALRSAPVHSVREIYGESLANYPVTNLEGDYQRWNAATATLVTRLLPAKLKPTNAAVATTAPTNSLRFMA